MAITPILVCGHNQIETVSGVSYCRRCHEKTDTSFAVDSQHLLDSLRDNSYHDLSRSKGGFMATARLFPSNLNIFLGTVELTQKRRAAYTIAMVKAGNRTLSQWAREVLDEAANFDASAPKAGL